MFVFLLFFIVAGTLTLGGKRTAVLLGITWAIAFLAEFSSTRIGIPFGDYYYIESTRDREIWVSNIPFIDSLSFTFLAYVSYTLSLFFFLKPSPEKPTFLQDDGSTRYSFRVLGLAVLFFVFLDVVIDPLALRGDRWFLGQIFGYASEGIYFGVPLSNFMGWAVVGSSSLLLFQWCDQKWMSQNKLLEVSVAKWVLGPLLYYIILSFNLIMTFVIGEKLLGIIGIFIHLPVFLFFLFRIWDIVHLSKLAHANSPQLGEKGEGGPFSQEQAFPFPNSGSRSRFAGD